MAPTRSWAVMRQVLQQSLISPASNDNDELSDCGCCRELCRLRFVAERSKGRSDNNLVYKNLDRVNHIRNPTNLESGIPAVQHLLL